MLDSVAGATRILLPIQIVDRSLTSSDYTGTSAKRGTGHLFSRSGIAMSAGD